MKDNLGHKMTANVLTLLKRSAFNQIPIKIYIVKDTANSMSKKQITNFCGLKKRTLQTFVILKCGHYNIVVSKSRHYKLL